MKQLNVFVSSTCYDLSQIRMDLREYFENCGYIPILSEFRDFPINPTIGTVENCLSAVNDNADIFVLIVGTRYGSQIQSDLSITNLEFLAAKDKGIPIYIFIDRAMINYLPLWKNNKSMDFSSIVDTTKIFEFISDLRESSNLWTFEFKNVQDIITVLKSQLSYLFKDALDIKSIFNEKIRESFKDNLSSEALSLILKKPNNYEIKFFFQTMHDELLKKETLKNDYKYSIILESKHAIFDEIELNSWIQQRFEILSNLISSLNKLIYDAFPKFYGESGFASDFKGLYYCSETYARIFESVINWTIEISSTCIKEDYKLLRDSLSKLSSKLIEQIWSFPPQQLIAINIAEENEKQGCTDNVFKSTLSIEIDSDDLAEFQNELEKFKSAVLSD